MAHAGHKDAFRPAGRLGLLACLPLKFLRIAKTFLESFLT